MLTADWKDEAKSVIAEKKTRPEEYADDDREEAFEERIANAHVNGDRTAEVASQKDRAKHRGSWNDVDQDTQKLNDPESDGQAKREAKLNECLHNRRRLHNMSSGIEEHE